MVWFYGQDDRNSPFEIKQYANSLCISVSDSGIQFEYNMDKMLDGCWMDGAQERES